MHWNMLYDILKGKNRNQIFNFPHSKYNLKYFWIMEHDEKLQINVKNTHFWYFCTFNDNLK